ncbi:hypothetical protein Q4Q35_13755 [Flavivirga aquimarina]|uniref:Tetratricopeptide repeat protein n=1 Tax=Flavivirga aquimarina TaxID=2027862 RepID=A0ABT8WCJ1_9FLAO|nr:hypothetical protein [Flavivirga aquimarina]MDO5970873.1 hypothetical protein [Flavivirga aquimarina]
MTKENLEYFKNNPSNNYCRMDCDLGALIYVSIGQLNNLKMHLVETNGHNFVRYEYSDKKYINWDNNSAQIFTDVEFQKGLTPSSSSTLTEDEIKKGHFLQNMPIEEIIGYHYTNTSRLAKENLKITKALEHLKQAVKIRPYSPLALNNLSWLYLTTKELESPENYNRALELSKRVDDILPRDAGYKDTYSCACAAIGNFKEAIRLGIIAGSSPLQIKGYKGSKTCLEMGIN